MCCQALQGELHDSSPMSGSVGTSLDDSPYQGQHEGTLLSKAILEMGGDGACIQSLSSGPLMGLLGNRWLDWHLQ